MRRGSLVLSIFFWASAPVANADDITLIFAPAETTAVRDIVVPTDLSLDLFLLFVRRASTRYSASSANIKWTHRDALNTLGFVGLRIWETADVWTETRNRSRPQASSEPFSRWTLMPHMDREDRVSLSFAMEI